MARVKVKVKTKEGETRRSAPLNRRAWWGGPPGLPSLTDEMERRT